MVVQSLQLRTLRVVKPYRSLDKPEFSGSELRALGPLKVLY